MKLYKRVTAAVAAWSMILSIGAAAERVIYEVEPISDNKVEINLQYKDAKPSKGIKVEGIEFMEQKIIKVTYREVDRLQDQSQFPFYYEANQYPAPIFLINSAEGEKKIFSDLATSGELYEAIMNLYYKGVLGGYGDGTVKANGSVTREQFAKMLVSIAGIELDKETDSAFKDVDNGRWSKPYIMTLYKYGIISGKGQGIFAPEETIDIGAMAAMVDRTFLFYEQTAKKSAKIGHWSDQYMQAIYDANIIKETDIFFKNPKKVATRGDSSLILHRVSLALRETKLN